VIQTCRDSPSHAAADRAAVALTRQETQGATAPRRPATFRHPARHPGATRPPGREREIQLHADCKPAPCLGIRRRSQSSPPTCWPMRSSIIATEEAFSCVANVMASPRLSRTRRRTGIGPADLPTFSSDSIGGQGRRARTAMRLGLALPGPSWRITAARSPHRARPRGSRIHRDASGDGSARPIGSPAFRQPQCLGACRGARRRTLGQRYDEPRLELVEFAVAPVVLMRSRRMTVRDVRARAG